jgi:hypothetical protein
MAEEPPSFILSLSFGERGSAFRAAGLGFPGAGVCIRVTEEPLASSSACRRIPLGPPPHAPRVGALPTGSPDAPAQPPNEIQRSRSGPRLPRGRGSASAWPMSHRRHPELVEGSLSGIRPTHRRRERSPPGPRPLTRPLVRREPPIGLSVRGGLGFPGAGVRIRMAEDPPSSSELVEGSLSGIRPTRRRWERSPPHRRTPPAHPTAPRRHEPPHPIRFRLAQSRQFPRGYLRKARSASRHPRRNSGISR